MSVATGAALRAPSPEVRPFSVAEYLQLIAAGILDQDESVELLEGWVIRKMTRGPSHDTILDIIHEEIVAPRLPPGWICRAQFAVIATDSVPEPDVAVVRGARRDFLTRHPGTAEVALVVEVADSSLEYDRTSKARIKAAGSIPTFWIVNLRDARVEVYTDPTGPDPAPAYRRRQDLKGQDAVEIVFDGHILGQVLAFDLLP